MLLVTATADAVEEQRLPLWHRHVNAAKIAEDSILCSVRHVVSRKIVIRLASIRDASIRYEGRGIEHSDAYVILLTSAGEG